MNAPRTFLFSLTAALMLWMPVLSAEGFRAAGFKFVKDVTLPAGSKGTYGRLSLDEDMIRHAGEYDRAFVVGDRLLPSFARPVPPAPGASGRRKPTVTHQSRPRGGRSVYILKLPKPPAGAVYRSIRVRRSGTFETSAYVSTAAKPGAWVPRGRRSLFRYQGGKPTRIRLQAPANHRFVRVEFDDVARYSFPYARYESERRVSEFQASVKLTDLKRSQDSDTKSTVYWFANERRLKIHRLVLRFAEKRYSRRLVVMQMRGRSRSYSRLLASRVSRRPGETQTDQLIEFPGPVVGPLKLIIENGDDRPLQLQDLKAFSPREELIVRLPEGSSTGKLRLYYGNRYLQPPDFDIRRTFDPAQALVRLRAGGHTKNPSFGYSVLEPPLSTWIIRALFYLGLLGLAWPAYRIFTAFARDAQDEPQLESS